MTYIAGDNSKSRLLSFQMTFVMSEYTICSINFVKKKIN